MNNTIKKFQIIMLIGVVLSVGGAAHMVYRTVFAVRGFSYSFDTMISPEIQQIIKDQVSLFRHNDAYNPSTVIETISSFPCVRSVSLHCRASHTADVVVEAYDPIVCINTSHVLTLAKTIIPASSYALYVINRLPSMAMRSVLPEYCSDRMMSAMKQCINDRIFDRYTLSWVNEHELYFKDLDDPTFSVLCDASSLPTHAALLSYEQVKKNIQKRNSMSRWVADLRFRDQIIVSRDQGGGYGKGV